MRTIVGVLRGGPGQEYDESLKSGAHVLEALNREKYEPRDIFIDRAGQWHAQGLPRSHELALKGVEVAFNALHGPYGEDGSLQRTLEKLDVPYTGSGPFASAIAFNKHHAKETLARPGVKVAHGQAVERGDTEKLAHQLFRTMPHPVIIRPAGGGMGAEATKAESFEALQFGLDRVFDLSPRALVEEYIKGKEAAVGVIDGFRGEETYALVPQPSTFTHEEKAALTDAAKKVHRGLELSHYSHSDFVVSKRGIYFLAVHTQPKLAKGSVLHDALAAVGAKLGDFVEHVLSLAKRR